MPGSTSEIITKCTGLSWGINNAKSPQAISMGVKFKKTCINRTYKQLGIFLKTIVQ